MNKIIVEFSLKDPWREKLDFFLLYQESTGSVI